MHKNTFRYVFISNYAFPVLDSQSIFVKSLPRFSFCQVFKATSIKLCFSPICQVRHLLKLENGKWKDEALIDTQYVTCRAQTLRWEEKPWINMEQPNDYRPFIKLHSLLINLCLGGRKSRFCLYLSLNNYITEIMRSHYSVLFK